MRDGVGDVQSVVVFGGTSDIALAVVRRLTRRRCRRVVLAARDPATRESRLDELPGGTTVSITPFDAASPDTHDDAVQRAFAAAGGDVDVVIVAFGQLGHQSGFDVNADEAVALSQVNFVGSVSVLLRVAQHLRCQGHGTIVVLSSVAGVRVRKTNFVYGATKAGLDAFAQGLGDYLFGSGVDVVIVRPGFVRTKMTAGMAAAPFAVDVDEVARAIEEGIRARRSVVWVPSVLRAVFVVMRVLPRSIWRRFDR